MSVRDEEFKAVIKQKLDEYRYHHSLCVADSARALAKKYGADAEKAYTAGLLHDVTKNASKEEHASLCKKYNLELTPLEATSPKLWHAMTGALFVEYELGVSDEEIITAVRYHTTGRANMSLLEKVIFTADFISADRSYSGVEEMRVFAQNSLEQAMLEGLKFTIKELMDANRAIHPDTLSAYNDIVMKGME